MNCSPDAPCGARTRGFREAEPIRSGSPAQAPAVRGRHTAKKDAAGIRGVAHRLRSRTTSCAICAVAGCCPGCRCRISRAIPVVPPGVAAAGVVRSREAAVRLVVCAFTKICTHTAEARQKNKIAIISSSKNRLERFAGVRSINPLPSILQCSSH